MSSAVVRIPAMIAAIVLVFGAASTFGQGYGGHVPEPPRLSGQRPFDLTLEETRTYAWSKNFDMADANGAGVTVLRWVGAMPRPPVPAAR